MVRNKILWAVFVTLVISVLLLGLTYKPSITTATYEELTEVYGIGHDRAQSIIYYCDANENATVEDLDYIDGIGFKTVDILKERWK